MQVPILVIAAWALLFACAAYRHAVFRSSAFDLGIFDQALWLLSRGEGAYVSLMGMNIFSDHGAFILYPVSFLYRIAASPYVLLALQSMALSLGMIPILQVAQACSLSRPQQLCAAGIYMLHPAIFSANLFDFHPETLGVPLLPLLMLFAQQRRYGLLVLVAALVMSCKEVLALTVSAMGVVMIVRGQRAIGLLLCATALAWFVTVTQVIMPGLPGGAAPNAFARYAYLGASLGEKAATILLRPWVALEHVSPLDLGLYLAALAAPCFWVFTRSSVALLIACAPTIVLNALSTNDFQRSLRFQYSLPLVPIFALMAIETFRSGKRLLWDWSAGRAAAFAAVALIVPLVARNAYRFGAYPVRWSADGPVEPLRDAVSRVPPDASVLASSRIVPHLSHRVEMGLVDRDLPLEVIRRYEYVAIDHGGSRDPAENAHNESVRGAAQASGAYEIELDLPQVSLLRRKRQL